MQAGVEMANEGEPAQQADEAEQPAGGAQAEDFTNLQRVKVYRLNESGHWDDKGTGHVSCEYMEVRILTMWRSNCSTTCSRRFYVHLGLGSRNSRRSHSYVHFLHFRVGWLNNKTTDTLPAFEPTLAAI